MYKKTILEYVWLDGNYNFRSKYRTTTNDLVEEWNYDGSSTNQADVTNSEIILRPVAVYNNPFLENARLVLCDTYHTNGEPTFSNTRALANNIFSNHEELDPWYGIEQEYFMMYSPLPKLNQPIEPQGSYYCGVGSSHIVNRQLIEKHYLYCLNAGLNISGINAEVAPNQWEFQVGPCKGIHAADQLMMARYILIKLAEQEYVYINFNPKPLPSPWNGSGMHTNFSTSETRKQNGITKIYDYIKHLSQRHEHHINVYGDNTQRLSGECETSSLHTFTYGIGTRNTSVRIPNQVYKQQKGYLEDRRPASNADPYLVTSTIFKTCCLPN